MKMKNTIIQAFTAIALLMTSASFADNFNIDELISIDSHMTGKDYQEVAKFYGSYMFNESRESHVFKIIKNPKSKEITQVYFYTDGYIITVLSGKNEGLQRVIFKEENIGETFVDPKTRRS